MWSTVIKMIPWGQVIDHAPEVFEGAKRLYGRIRKEPPVETSVPADADLPDDLSELERLRHIAESSRQELIRLHQDVVESGKLISALADQNAQIIRETEILRKKLRTMAWLGFFGLLAIIYLLYRTQG